MHYANNTFSNKDVLLTIRTREKYSKETSKIGQRRNLSKSDIIQTNKLYQCTSLFINYFDKTFKFKFSNILRLHRNSLRYGRFT